MKVKELKAALEGVPDDLDVIIRAEDNEDYSICADAWHAGIDHAHDGEDTPFFAIEADQNEHIEAQDPFTGDVGTLDDVACLNPPKR